MSIRSQKAKEMARVARKETENQGKPIISILSICKSHVFFKTCLHLLPKLRDRILKQTDFSPELVQPFFTYCLNLHSSFAVEKTTNSKIFPFC